MNVRERRRKRRDLVPPLLRPHLVAAAVLLLVASPALPPHLQMMKKEAESLEKIEWTQWDPRSLEAARRRRCESMN